MNEYGVLLRCVDSVFQTCVIVHFPFKIVFAGADELVFTLRLHILGEELILAKRKWVKPG